MMKNIDVHVLGEEQTNNTKKKIEKSMSFGEFQMFFRILVIEKVSPC